LAQERRREHPARSRPVASRARSIVHDGSPDPEGPEIVDDFRGADAAINRLLSKCATVAACASKYPDLRTRFLAALPDRGASVQDSAIAADF